MNVENIVPMRLPPPTLRPPREPHVTVLLTPVVQAIEPREGGLYVDATLGGGGHAEATLETPGAAVDPDLVSGVADDRHIALATLRSQGARCRRRHARRPGRTRAAHQAERRAIEAHELPVLAVEDARPGGRTDRRGSLLHTLRARAEGA